MASGLRIIPSRGVNDTQVAPRKKPLHTAGWSLPVLEKTLCMLLHSARPHGPNPLKSFRIVLGSIMSSITHSQQAPVLAAGREYIRLGHML